MKLINTLLIPLSILYGSVLSIRNWLYDSGIFKQTNFTKPAIISVGNLNVGGTGKTPHIEYLIRLLKDNYRIATLSRGYGRDTSGFLLAQDNYTASEIGDEPLQFKKKFPQIPVAVDSDRVRGINKLIEEYPDLDIILLDDAFQHRAVKSNISILLTDFNDLFYNDNVLPYGRLREFKSGYRRADIIIVTKCPPNLTPLDKKIIQKNIEPLQYQKVFFSELNYGSPISLNNINKNADQLLLDGEQTIVLLTAIANPDSLKTYLTSKSKEIVQLSFADHHQFSLSDIRKLVHIFDNISSEKKFIVTTEKDVMRITKPELIELIKDLPIYYIPVEISLNKKEEDEIRKQIENHVRVN